MVDFRIAVIGDKNFSDYGKVKSTLDSFIKIHNTKSVGIVSGDSGNTDLMAQQYADENGLSFECFPSDRGRYGNVAGYIKNKDMVNKSDRVIAFWNGHAGETKHAIDEANKEGIPAYVVAP